MGAQLLSTPELKLEESEAGQLSSHLKNVAKYYAISIDPKKLAIGQLVFCMAGIYGSRGIAIYKRHADEAKARPRLAMVAPKPPASPPAAAVAPAAPIPFEAPEAAELDHGY